MYISCTDPKRCLYVHKCLKLTKAHYASHQCQNASGGKGELPCNILNQIMYKHKECLLSILMKSMLLLAHIFTVPQGHLSPSFFTLHTDHPH